MNYKLLTPDKCDQQQLKIFHDIVVEGGQVLVDGLEDRIKAADFLSFCESENEIVCIASIKNPNNRYNPIASTNVPWTIASFKHKVIKR